MSEFSKSIFYSPSKVFLFSILIPVFFFGGCGESRLRGRARISQQRALQIAAQQDEAQAFFQLRGGIYKSCIESAVQEPCQSDYVTCIDDSGAWVVHFFLKKDCPFQAEERVGIYYLIASDGKILSRFPETDYFQDSVHCKMSGDCVCSVSDEKGGCSRCENFLYAPLNEDSGVVPEGAPGCFCREDRCVLPDSK